MGGRGLTVLFIAAGTLGFLALVFLPIRELQDNRIVLIALFAALIGLGVGRSGVGRERRSARTRHLLSGD